MPRRPKAARGAAGRGLLVSIRSNGVVRAAGGFHGGFHGGFYGGFYGGVGLPQAVFLVDVAVGAQASALEVDGQHPAVELAGALGGADHVGLIHVGEDRYVAFALTAQRRSE